MKKFDINKWRREQKALHKKQKIQESKSPIRNKKKLTEEQRKLLTEQVGVNALDWWGDQGFYVGAPPSDITGKLYVCDGTTYTGVVEYTLGSANGVGSTTEGDAIQAAVWDALKVDPFALDPYFSNTGAYQEHVSQANGGSGSPTDQYWVTPMDVVHYCLANPGITNLGGQGFNCDIIYNMSTAGGCGGGMWVGDKNGAPFTPSMTPVGGMSTLTQQNHQIGPGVEVFYNKDASAYWTAVNNGDCTISGPPPPPPFPPACGTAGTVYHTAQYYTAAIIGGTAANNNCQGPQEACDDSWYWFGCDDPNSVNYNELQTGTIDGSAIYDSSGTVWASPSQTLGSFYGGITGNGFDSNSWTWTFDSQLMTWTQNAYTFQSTFDSQTNIVQGCGTEGIPDPNNDHCCEYLGCQQINHVPANASVSNFPVVNYGIWTWDEQTIVTPTTGWMNEYRHVMGCPTPGSPLIPNLSDPYGCCKIVGCPPSNGAKTVRYDSQAGGQILGNAYSWTQLNYLPTEYDTAVLGGAQIGCAGIDGLGIWSEFDSSCCLPPRVIDSNVGCHDSNAINTDRNTDTGNIISGGAVGCLAGSGGVPWTGDYWDSNFVGDSSNYSCCNYSACVHNLQYEYPHNGAGSSIYNNYGFYGDSINMDNNDLIDLPADSNYSMLPEIDGTAGCPAGNGYDILPDNLGIPDIDCCQYRLNGCPDSSANNFDENSEGCSSMGTGMFANIFDSNLLDSNFVFSTVCCNYLGCQNPLFDNYGTINPPAPGYGALTGVPPTPEYGYNFLGGNTGCDSNIPLDSFSDANDECCVKYGCMDPNAANYDQLATYPCDITGVGPGTYPGLGECCSYGGCHDSSTAVFKHPTSGQMETYHLAENYDPQSSGCTDFSGTIDSSDYSCCNYFTCQDPNAYNAGYTPNIQSFFIGAYTTTHWTAAAASTSCVNQEYRMNDDNTWHIDTTNNAWCCVYAGCTDPNARNFDSSVVPNYNGSPSTYYWDCHENLIGLGANDSNMWQITYDSSIVSQGCCTVSGCSDNTNPYVRLTGPNALITLPAGVIDSNMWYYQNATCEPGFGNNNIGPDPILDYTEYSCCEYTGCVDFDAANFIDIDQGDGGCETIPGNPATWTINDKTCCTFVGCPDSNAYNYGAFSPTFWSNPNMTTGQGVTEGTFGCPTVDYAATGNIDTASRCCCQYRLGCTDSAAVAGQQYGNNSYGVNCPSCNYDDEAIACYTNSTGCMNFPWSTEMGNSAFDDGTAHPGPMNLGYGPLITNNEECCNYQVGCPDSQANIPGVYFLGNLGCDTNVWPFYIPGDTNCCNTPPVYGCMDSYANNYLSSFIPTDPTAVATHECPMGIRIETPFSFTPDTNDAALQVPAIAVEAHACCDYTGTYSCNDPDAIGVDYGAIGTFPSGYNTNNYGPPFDGRPLTDVKIHPWSGWMQDPNQLTAFTTNGEINPNTPNPDSPDMWCKEDYNATGGTQYDSLIIIHDYCYDPNISRGCSGYPGSQVPPGNECCQFDYGCPLDSAVNYNYDPMGYAGFRGGLGCTDALDLLIGIPDSSKQGCCRWDSNTIGCKDPMANNHDASKLGCTNGTLSNGGYTQPPSPNNKSCCIYTYGCADSMSVGYVNDSMHQGCSNVSSLTYPQQDPSDLSCCNYVYGCGAQYHPTLQNQGWPNFPLIYNNYNPAVIGCEDTSGTWNSPQPNPNNFECCEYNYGCAEPSSTTYNAAANGCHDSQNIPSGFTLPNPSSTVCCGDYNYNCTDASASNYILTMDPWGELLGCADTNIPTSLVPGTSISYQEAASGPINNDTNLYHCCKYAYGCADTNSPLVSSGTEGPGCNPNGPIGDQSSLDSFTQAVDSNYNCCFYVYGCGDPLSISVPNTGPGCNPSNPTSMTTGYGSPPDTAVTGCCAYIYGCADINAVPYLGGIQVPNYYDPSNLGCHPLSDTNGTAGIPPYRSQVYQNNLSHPPDTNNHNCCKYAYNCADHRSTTYDTNQDPDETGIIQGCNPDNSSPTAPPDYNYPIDTNRDCCLYQYGCADRTINSWWNYGDPIEYKFKATNSIAWPEWQYQFDQQYQGYWNPHGILMGYGCESNTSMPYAAVSNPLGIGSNPPDSLNYSCCNYGCDNIYNSPTQTWWPGNINANVGQANHIQVLHNHGGINQWSSQAYVWAWATAWPLFPGGISFFGDQANLSWSSGGLINGGGLAINGVTGQVCCVDTEAAGYQAGNLASYTLVYPSEDCDCYSMGANLTPVDSQRYMQVDCDLNFPICNICCINKTLATASMILEGWVKQGLPTSMSTTPTGVMLANAVQNELGGIGAFNVSKFDDMITMFTTPGQMWSGNIGQNMTINYGAHIAWYDPNNTSSWGFYLRPPGSHMDPSFPCGCVSELGTPHFDIKEIDCYAGFEIGCLPPLNPIYAGIPAASLPPIDQSNFEDYYGCHLQPDYVHIHDCGLAHPLGDSHVFCESIKSFDETTCTCEWDCPVDWCWCHEPSNDIVDPGVNPNTEWCCADPTTGIIYDIDDNTVIPNASTTNNQGMGGTSNSPWVTGGKPQPHHYSYDDNEGRYYLANNWKGCPTVGHGVTNPLNAGVWAGTTSWGYADDYGIDNTSPNGSPLGIPIPNSPPMMIVPCNSSCNRPYNETKQVINHNNASDFPIAFWSCGCPDIHYTPVSGGTQGTAGQWAGGWMRQHGLYRNNGQNGINHVFPHGWPIDMGASDWSHQHLGCPTDVGEASWYNKNWPANGQQPAPIPLRQHNPPGLGCGYGAYDSGCSTHGFPNSGGIQTYHQDDYSPVNRDGLYPGDPFKRIGTTDQMDCCMPLYDSNEFNENLGRRIGCDHSLAVNFDPIANGCDLSGFPDSSVDSSNLWSRHKRWCCDYNWPNQGSQYPEPLGCSNPIAANYDPNASACPMVMHGNYHNWFLWHTPGQQYYTQANDGEELTYAQKCGMITHYMAMYGSMSTCYYTNAQIDQIIEYNKIGFGPTSHYDDCCDFGNQPACIAQNDPSLMGQSKADDICGWCNLDETFDPECGCCDTYSGQNIYGQYCSGYGYLRSVDIAEPYPCCGGDPYGPQGSVCYDAMSTHNPSNGANNINAPEMNTMPNTAASAAYHKKVELMFPDQTNGPLLHHGYTAAGNPPLYQNGNIINGAKDVNAMGGTGYSTLSFPFEQGSCTPIYLTGYGGANSESFAYACTKPGIKGNLQWKMGRPVDSNEGILQIEDMLKYLQSLNINDFGIPFDASQCTQMNINNPEITTALEAELERAVDSNEINRAQRILNYYKELSAFCEEVFTTPVPEYCLELPPDSPYLSETSDECIKCTEERTLKVANQIKADEPDEPGEIREQDQEERPLEEPQDTTETNIDYCDCCEQMILPLPDTNIDGVDTNIADTNIFVLPPKPEEIPKTVNIDTNATAINVPIGPTPEEIEYERRTKEYEAKRSDLISQGWVEGQVDSMVDDPNDYDVKTLINQDDETVYFKRKKPTTPGSVSEPEPTIPTPVPDEPTFPTAPEPLDPFVASQVPAPKVTKESLKRMVKNAIREIKKKSNNPPPHLKK